MSHLKVAYMLGVQHAAATFEKTARDPRKLRRLLDALKDTGYIGTVGGMGAVPAMPVGAAIGAGTGALTSEEGERGIGALRGAGLGALLGGLGGGAGGLTSVLAGRGKGYGTTGEMLARLLRGQAPGAALGGIGGGLLGRKTGD